mmetsp:Transcript_71167/g.197057  ORF Transcript_71167/g.197057 Transcript_71167/m.197057 type:complete len:357 (-) Transcript_71167:132-1202(-)
MPSTAAASARGCAALASAAALMRSSWSRAFSHTARASGSVVSSAARSMAGRMEGRNGAASDGSSTSLDMLVMMTAHWRTMAVSRAFMPRCSSGTTTARAGVSTDCTKVSEASLWMVSGTSEGFSMASTRQGRKGSRSRFSTMVQAALAASLAAVATPSCRSCSNSVSTGTRAVRCTPSCTGADLVRVTTHSRAAHLDWCLLATSSRTAMMAGTTLTAALGVLLSRVRSASTALTACAAVPLWRSATRVRGRCAIGATNGSARRPIDSHRLVSMSMAPWRMSGFFLLAAAASISAGRPKLATAFMPSALAMATIAVTASLAASAFSVRALNCAFMVFSGISTVIPLVVAMVFEQCRS